MRVNSAFMVFLLSFFSAYAGLSEEEKGYINSQLPVEYQSCSIEYLNYSGLKCSRIGFYEQEGYWVNVTKNSCTKTLFIPKQNTKPCLTPLGMWASLTSALSVGLVLYKVLPIINRYAKGFAIAMFFHYALANINELSI